MLSVVLTDVVVLCLGFSSRASFTRLRSKLRQPTKAKGKVFGNNEAEVLLHEAFPPEIYLRALGKSCSSHLKLLAILAVRGIHPFALNLKLPFKQSTGSRKNSSLRIAARWQEIRIAAQKRLHEACAL